MKACCDKELLSQQYSGYGKTIAQIAEESGCSRNTVVRRLQQFEIPRRARSKINGKKTGPVPRNIPERFLREWYTDQEKSMAQIAEEIGCNQTTIRDRLLLYGIPIRDQHHCKPANHIELTEGLLEYLDGTLLGDGCLVAENDLSAYYTLAQKHFSYLLWVSSFLAGYGLEQTGRIHSWQSPKSPRLTYRYASRCYRELRGQYDRWYPDGTKHVPIDVRLTPLSVRAWFLEDGCWGAKHGVRFAACGFTKDGIDILADGLKKILDTPYIHVNAHGYISFGRKEVVGRFFKYILPLQEELWENYGYKYANKRETR